MSTTEVVLQSRCNAIWKKRQAFLEQERKEPPPSEFLPGYNPVFQNDSEPAEDFLDGDSAEDGGEFANEFLGMLDDELAEFEATQDRNGNDGDAPANV